MIMGSKQRESDRKKVVAAEKRLTDVTYGIRDCVFVAHFLRHRSNNFIILCMCGSSLGHESE
jgi:hypothetical protein